MHVYRDWNGDWDGNLVTSASLSLAATCHDDLMSSAGRRLVNEGQHNETQAQGESGDFGVHGERYDDIVEKYPQILGGALNQEHIP